MGDSKRVVDHYLIHVTLMLKGCTLSIIQLYYPPNDKEVQSRITSYIEKHVAHTEDQKLHFTIIMGDFNSIVDSNLDRDGSTRFNKRPSNLVTKLLKWRYIDSLRYI